MSPAGVFLALAVFAAARAWLSESRPPRIAVSVALFAVLTCGWAFRAAGTHHTLRRTAAMQRAEWIQVDAWLDRQRIPVDDVEARRLLETLRRDAIWSHPTPFQPARTWTRWFDIDY